jgi:endoglucanase
MHIRLPFGLGLVASIGSAALATGCFSDPSAAPNAPAVAADGSRSTSTPAAGLRGCAVSTDAAPTTAPGGYYTVGAQVCTADGQPHLFHGVDRPSLEWSSVGENITVDDFQQMASWHANVVRIATNQDFWLSGAALYDPGYASTIQNAVTEAEQAGLDVILDLHWSDRGDLTIATAGGNLPSGAQANDTKGYNNQQPMADVNSVEFWKEVATQFKGDGHVLFELYNEPNSVTWDTWLNGGLYQDYQVHGMQELYETVRGTGANNLVVVGGLDWAYDLSGVATHPVNGFNVMYATHPYEPKSNWSTAFEYLLTGNVAPVIATEFGDHTAKCTGAWDQKLIALAAEPTVQMSWTAWAWYPGVPSCSFPALISDWSYDLTVQGQAVHDALANDPLPQSWLDASVVDAGAGDASEVDASAGDAGGGDAGVPRDAPGADASVADASVADASVGDAPMVDAAAVE